MIWVINNFYNQKLTVLIITNLRPLYLGALLTVAKSCINYLLPHDLSVFIFFHWVERVDVQELS
jgi:hypothetical protein